MGVTQNSYIPRAWEESDLKVKGEMQEVDERLGGAKFCMGVPHSLGNLAPAKFGVGGGGGGGGAKSFVTPA